MKLRGVDPFEETDSPCQETRIMMTCSAARRRCWRSRRALCDPAGVRREHRDDLLLLRDRLVLQPAALDRVPQTVGIVHIGVTFFQQEAGIDGVELDPDVRPLGNPMIRQRPIRPDWCFIEGVVTPDAARPLRKGPLGLLQRLQPMPCRPPSRDTEKRAHANRLRDRGPDRIPQPPPVRQIRPIRLHHETVAPRRQERVG